MSELNLNDLNPFTRRLLVLLFGGVVALILSYLLDWLNDYLIQDYVRVLESGGTGRYVSNTFVFMMATLGLILWDLKESRFTSFFVALPLSFLFVFHVLFNIFDKSSSIEMDNNALDGSAVFFGLIMYLSVYFCLSYFISSFLTKYFFKNGRKLGDTHPEVIIRGVISDSMILLVLVVIGTAIIVFYGRNGIQVNLSNLLIAFLMISIPVSLLIRHKVAHALSERGKISWIGALGAVLLSVVWSIFMSHFMAEDSHRVLGLDIDIGPISFSSSQVMRYDEYIEKASFDFWVGRVTLKENLLSLEEKCENKGEFESEYSPEKESEVIRLCPQGIIYTSSMSLFFTFMLFNTWIIVWDGITEPVAYVLESLLQLLTET